MGRTVLRVLSGDTRLESRQPRFESLESLGYHWGSCIGDGIQLWLGLSEREGRNFDRSLPWNLGGERADPSPKCAELMASSIMESLI